MTPIFRRLSLAVALLALPLAAQAAPPQKIDEAKARATALKLAPGKIVDHELEKENGGWRYSYDIQQGKRIHEIGVDAYTGKIVEDSYEAPGAKD